MSELDVAHTTTTNVGTSSDYSVDSKATDNASYYQEETYWDFSNAAQNLGYYKQIPELKFHNSSQSIRERVLKCFSKTDNDIAYVILRKEQVYPSLREERTILYNYMSGMLLSKIIKAYNWEGSLDLIIDKSLYNSQRDNFDNYLTRKASALNVTLNPSHPDSQRERGVQAADYVAGAINQMVRV